MISEVVVIYIIIIHTIFLLKKSFVSVSKKRASFQGVQKTSLLIFQNLLRRLLYIGDIPKKKSIFGIFFSPKMFLQI